MLFVYLVSQVTNKLPTTNSIGEILLTISRAHVATCPVVYIYIYMYCYCDCFGNWITIGRPLSCSADSRTRRLARACGICQHAGSSARVSGMQVVVEIIWDMWGYEAFHQILTGLYSRSLHISDWLMCIMFALAAYTYPYVNITSTGLLLGSNEKNECVVWLCCMIFLGV